MPLIRIFLRSRLVDMGESSHVQHPVSPSRLVSLDHPHYAYTNAQLNQAQPLLRVLTTPGALRNRRMDKLLRYHYRHFG